MPDKHQVYQSIVLQFANTLLTGRLPVAADADVCPDAISDVATSRFRHLFTAARDAVALYQRRTAPPAIAEEVIREFNGRPQTLQIVSAQTPPPIVTADIRRMACAIQGAICLASSASAEADRLCLQVASESDSPAGQPVTPPAAQP